MGRARLIIELEVEAEIALDGRFLLGLGRMAAPTRLDLGGGEVGGDVAVGVTWQ